MPVSSSCFFRSPMSERILKALPIFWLSSRSLRVARHYFKNWTGSLRPSMINLRLFSTQQSLHSQNDRPSSLIYFWVSVMLECLSLSASILEIFLRHVNYLAIDLTSPLNWSYNKCLNPSRISTEPTLSIEMRL
jgi:hypothetical protein